MLDPKKSHFQALKASGSSIGLKNTKRTNFFSYIYQTINKLFKFAWEKTGKFLWIFSTGIFLFFIFRIHCLGPSLCLIFLQRCHQNGNENDDGRYQINYIQKVK
jgi:hypothetical protein